MSNKKQSISSQESRPPINRRITCFMSGFKIKQRYVLDTCNFAYLYIKYFVRQNNLENGGLFTYSSPEGARIFL